MTKQTNPAVVVGFDGSEPSLLALELAADEALRRHQPLRMVCGLSWPMFSPASPIPGSAMTDDTLRTVEGMLDTAAAELRNRHPDLDIGTHVVVGNPAGVLVDESEHASVVVVGNRGRGGFASLLTGSVATQVAAHAHSPIIIVRPGTGPSAIAAATHPVVVGVDGSELSEAAIEFAFDEASSRGVSLTAVHAWSEPPRPGVDQFKPVPVDFDEARKDAARALAESLAGFQEKYPDVRVFRELIDSLNPAHELQRASEEAGLVVVGTRGRGGFAGLLLGSVSQALIHHARCAVAVVRAAATSES